MLKSWICDMFSRTGECNFDRRDGIFSYGTQQMLWAFPNLWVEELEIACFFFSRAGDSASAIRVAAFTARLFQDLQCQGRHCRRERTHPLHTVRRRGDLTRPMFVGGEPGPSIDP